jgi:hypothetical protein
MRLDSHIATSTRHYIDTRRGKGLNVDTNLRLQTVRFS